MLNSLAGKALLCFFSLILLACSNQQQPDSNTVTTQIKMLSGTGSHDAIEWDFYCNQGQNCGKWSKIAVPSNWELQGFGHYNYGTDKTKHNEQGIYRRYFTLADNWQNKTIKIVFDGVMTDATVLVNNQQVGPKHQGGFYRFSYDITPFIHFNQPNELKVIVDKVSANSSIETAERQADYWVFGGIFRQVFLQALPQNHIDWVSLDAKASGEFKLNVYLAQKNSLTTASLDKVQVVAQIQDLNGNHIGDSFKAPLNNAMASLNTHINSPALWSAETPNLYQVNIKLQNQHKTLHQITKTFGFRTFELKPHDGLYLNGEKIILKGVNRHSFRPQTGRTTTPQISIDDIKLIKNMNMNAVRMSHYPPDVHFLEAADKLGIYVINELTTWQKPAYDTASARRLVAQLVKRDQVHPSILFWANGNEGGWNTEVDDDYAKYDLQNRPVMHPWELFRHLDTDHYPTYQDLLAKPAQGEVFMPTEFLHGLYDGGHGAGLRDFWDLMMSSPLGAGGFLWVLADEGVARTDQNGKIDTDGNHAPDGIIGPNGELEASYFTIKEIWSPLQLTNLTNGQLISTQFNGQLNIKNLYDFNNLTNLTLEWRLYKTQTAFDKATHSPQLFASSEQVLPKTQPDNIANLQLNLPANWQQQGWLEVEIFDKTQGKGKQKSIINWSWPIQTAQQNAALTAQTFKQNRVNKIPEQAVKIIHSDKTKLIVQAADLTLEFAQNSGRLMKYQRKGRVHNLTNGPLLVRSDDSLHNKNIESWQLHDPTQNEAEQKSNTRLQTQQINDGLKITLINPPKGIVKQVWTVHKQGYLSLDLDYHLDGHYVLHGISFNYPQSAFTQKQWLGKGPYRVWANRLEGVNYGVWQNEYNQGIAGENWIFPEFKGYFANINWLAIGDNNNRIHFSTPNQNLFARVLQPENASQPANTLALEYQGEISFLNRISPIGTKFNQPKNLGPQGQAAFEQGIQNIKLDIF
ncbi:hypothetical protein N7931_13005 [Catenovulum sp. 2E275]|uniref:glycoside hydrolase family 2 TIM barrel-domain containing protein n=1 Tax=Catenovulum sp. 2E275 TaxID=2980497 RepID=UPI0021CF8E02|nr:glycoside hydrolase family 2 TIM barrel-domain containing protein [Catenovulum sp. 2E275]MCU4676549.1 hypothetical protein [Catenovulum sp. 2E275]